MDRIERRQYQILQRIAAAGRYISGAEIAAALKISAKTVRKDIECLTAQMEPLGITILKKAGLGYWMEPDSVIRFQRMGVKSIETSQNPVKNQRIHYLAQRLLAEDDYIKSAKLADELFVSQTIISAELRSVRKLLAGYGLELENMPSHGIRVRGAEQYIRSCVIQEYCEAQAVGERPFSVPAFRELFQIEPSLAGAVHQAVMEVLAGRNRKPYYISESHMQKIELAIYLSISRARWGKQMRFSPKEVYETKILRSYQAALEILRLVGGEASAGFSEADGIYLANLILGYRTFLRFDEVAVKENYYRAVDRANEAIMQLHIRYGVKEFVYDRELKERVALYLLSMEGRMVTHMLLENMISREMSRSFILAREFAIYMGPLLEKSYHCVLHHSEIDRLAIVFLPSIPKIKNEIQQNRSIAIISQEYSRDIATAIALRHLNCCDGLARRVVAYESYQLADVVNSRCDLLLTDIPSNRFEGFQGDILYYSFSLSSEDQCTIMNWYQGKEIIWNRLKKFFHPELYFPNCQCRTKKDVLRIVGERLMESNYTDTSIFADLEHNSRRRFTIANNGIGFVKTLYTYGERSFCAVFQFSKPVEWEGNYLQYLFVLGTGSSEPEDFLLFNGWMESLLQDENYPLLSSQTFRFPELLETLHNYYLKH